MAYDVEVSNHGTIHIVTPATDDAMEWLEMCATEGMWISGGLAVEARFTIDLLLAMQDEGFRVPLEAKGVEA